MVLGRRAVNQVLGVPGKPAGSGWAGATVDTAEQVWGPCPGGETVDEGRSVGQQLPKHADCCQAPVPSGRVPSRDEPDGT